MRTIEKYELGHVVAIATEMSAQRGHDLPHKVQGRIVHYMKGNVALFHKMLNLTMSPGPMDKSDKGKLTIRAYNYLIR